MCPANKYHVICHICATLCATLCAMYVPRNAHVYIFIGPLLVTAILPRPAAAAAALRRPLPLFPLSGYFLLENGVYLHRKYLKYLLYSSLSCCRDAQDEAGPPPVAQDVVTAAPAHGKAGHLAAAPPTAVKTKLAVLLLMLPKTTMVILLLPKMQMALLLLPKMKMDLLLLPKMEIALLLLSPKM